MIRTFTLTSLLLALCVSAEAAKLPSTLTIEAGKTDLSNVPLTVSLKGTDAKAGSFVSLKGQDGKLLFGQIGEESKLTFILPELKAERSTKLAIHPIEAIAGELFSWTEQKGEYSELKFGKTPVMRFMNAALDETNKDTRFRTFKVFHHLFDPTGATLLTNGPAGTFPHHRGLFFGFNRISYGNKSADVWHCNKNEYQSYDKTISSETGPIMGSQTVSISWHGQDKAIFAEETRRMAVYHISGGHMLDFASTVESRVDDPIKLDGDPQHAGFHFRATTEIEKDKSKTYYLRPDGQGKQGETRNWDAKGKATNTVNLPWNAMSFVLADKRYTVLRINHPGNPGESRGSERDYGRFGDYFEYTITKDKPLNVKYRVWVQEGEMTVEQCNAMRDAFVNPPKVKVD